jgi:EpsI family protein
MVMKSRFIAVYLLLIAAGLYLNLHSDITVPMNRPFDQFPGAVREWRLAGESSLSDSVQKVLKATDVLSRQYVSPEGKQVNLYIGYHGGGKESGEIHSPRHCLPGSGWSEVSTRRTDLDVTGERVNLVQAVYQKGENRELFLYWFQVRNKTISEEYTLKMAEITNSICYRRRDAAFVRISVPFETDEEQALACGVCFIRDFYPVIRDFLPI